MKKFLYWFVSLTWGFLMNLIGFLVAVFLICIGKIPHKLGHTFMFYFGRGWGGVTLGAVVIVCKDCSPNTITHEYGHTIQNLIFGPFEVFIGIASACRYWYRELKFYRKGKLPKTSYDSIWFEGQATNLGYKYLN